MCESKVRKKEKLYLKHFKVYKKRMSRIEIKSLTGVLPEPVKIVPKEKVWIMENFFTKLFQGEEQDMC